MTERHRSIPLEHVAPVYVEPEDGYVSVKQGHGDHTLYTPEEIRDLAKDLLNAAEHAERT